MFSSALLLLGLASISQCCEVSRINGTKIKPEQLQYQVSVKYKQPIYTAHLCTGSLINPLYVITVAQCVHNFEPDMLVIVRLMNISGKINYTRRHEVRELIKHDDYDHVTKNNDIALLRLYNPFGLWRTYRYPRLPEQNKLVSTGTQAILSGFFRVFVNRREIGVTYEQTRVYAINRDGCQRLDSNIRDTNICVLDPCEMVNCTGNKGGLLVTNGILVGLATRPRRIRNCTIYDSPMILIRVSAYINWIKTSLSNRKNTDKYPSSGHQSWFGL